MVNFDALYALDGTVIPGAGLRQQLQREIGDRSGIAAAGDLLIQPLNTPGPGVRISPGAALVQCRAAGREKETYAVPLSSEQTWMGDGGAGIPGTGSGSGRTDFLFLEVLDESFATVYTPKSEWPADTGAKLSIVQNVGSASRMDDIPALNNVTGVELARITYPPSTDVIAPSMAALTDLRRLHRERTARFFRPVDMTSTQVLSSTAAYPDGVVFPAEFASEAGMVTIPSWATHARIAMTWGAVSMPGVAERRVHFWVQIGANSNPDRVVTAQGISNADAGTDTWVRAQTVAIPPALRGVRTSIFPKARLAFTVPTANRPEITTASAILLDVEFFEAAGGDLIDFNVPSMPGA